MPALKTRTVSVSESDPSRVSDTDGPALPVTRWSLVLKAARDDAKPEARSALDELVEMYRGPVSAFARDRGYSEEQSSALVSEFFETLHARKAFDSVNRGDRRFRVWLLSSLKEFL